MSHIFISYSHADKDKLTLLVEKLKSSGFSDEEIWFDKHIKPGGDWRDEIEEKLKEAYVVVVIVTSESMRSTYVTYEWSWALGYGIPVIPLLFENIPYAGIHSRLGTIQHINCIQGIGNDAIDALQTSKRSLPDIRYIDQLIDNIVQPPRVLIRIVLWLFPYT